MTARPHASHDHMPQGTEKAVGSSSFSVHVNEVQGGAQAASLKEHLSSVCTFCKVLSWS